jgi:hypothetical protein
MAGFAAAAAGIGGAVAACALGGGEGGVTSFAAGDGGGAMGFIPAAGGEATTGCVLDGGDGGGVASFTAGAAGGAMGLMPTAGDCGVICFAAGPWGDGVGELALPPAVDVFVDAVTGTVAAEGVPSPVTGKGAEGGTSFAGGTCDGAVTRLSRSSGVGVAAPGALADEGAGATGAAKAGLPG